MPERKLFGQDVLVKAIEAISANITQETVAYLIGGLNMILDGAKLSTKDVDLVFDDESSATRFIQASEKVGFKQKQDLTADYRDLNTRAVLQNADGVWFDVFQKRVCKSLVLSKGMKERALLVLEYGQLHIYSCSSEDMFLFKAITMRSDDLIDIRSLLLRELNMGIVEEEVKSQPEYWEWIVRLYDRLVELRDIDGILLSIIYRIERDADICRGIQTMLKELKKNELSIDNAVSILGNDKEYTIRVLGRMITLGLVCKKGEKYYKVEK